MNNNKNKIHDKLVKHIWVCLDAYFPSHQGELDLVNALSYVPTEINPLGDNSINRDAICRVI